MNWLQPWHLIILVIALIVLFGAKRLPDAARSIGKSMKIFKAETRGLKDDSETPAASPAEESADATRHIAPPSDQERIAKLQSEIDALKQRSPHSTPGSSSPITPHDSTK